MKILDKIKNVNDIKLLNENELNILAKELRGFLIKSVSKTGGHLASNLGVVELTIALMYCFNFDEDKIVFDVGHQSYLYKILTNRKNQFSSLRRFDGLCGFPKVSESKYDFFDVGHASTSISVAHGMAFARDLENKNYNVISLIGDGALMNGLAFEALNSAGGSKKKMLVILNDNQMSIGESVGGFINRLNEIRLTPNYESNKRDINEFLKNIPVVGEDVSSFVQKTKDSVKYFLLKTSLFEEFGFKYIGPVNGHDTKQLIKVLNQIKETDEPVLLHVYTQKGRGYKFASENPEKYHGVPPFNIKTGEFLNKSNSVSCSEIFADSLIEIAEKNEKVVAISAAMTSGTGLTDFANKFPERFFDVGIAEGHGVTFAGGLAVSGHIPVFAIYSTFLQRAYDNIIHDVCLQNLHVVFAIDRSGIVGEDGATHQGVFDISFLSHIPNMTIISPKNQTDLKNALFYAINEHNAPIAIRYPRGSLPTLHNNFHNDFSKMKSEIIFEGDDCAIISVGDMFEVCYNVAERLKEKNIKATLINLNFIKPLDLEMIKSLHKYNKIFIAENNIKQGGVYSIILNALNKFDIFAKVYSFSFPDEFIPHGSLAKLFETYGLDEDSIYNKIINELTETTETTETTEITGLPKSKR